ncbi:SAM-dependent methyltransferase [Streptomyces canus]|uniref:SAM-dependent methyltransferase n=1 Tax=Streptomyces canus TaxID=58343 RepID=UPI00358E3F74
MAAVNSSVAHPARVCNAWLGGRDTYTADQEAAEPAAATNLQIVPAVRADRAFLGWAVRELAGKAGIRRFLGIGTGIPTGADGGAAPLGGRIRAPESATSTTTRSSSPTPAR